MSDSKAKRERGSGPRPEVFEVLSGLLHGTRRDFGPTDLVPEVVPDLDGSEDLAALDREREQLFDQVPPFASVFLEADGSVGGDLTSAMARRLRSVGVEQPVDGPADHVCNELALLARVLELEGARSSADRADGAPNEAVTFLDGHLLWWIPALVSTLLRHGSPYWSRVAGSVLTLVVEQRSALVGQRAPLRRTPWNLMGLPPDPLTDPRVKLRAVAIFLSHPVRSGLFISDADARSLGHRHRVPPGGRPAQVLESAFHSALAYGGIDEACEQLRTIAAEASRVLTNASEVDGLHESFLTPWLQRLEQTRTMLARMGSGDGPRS